MIEAFLGVVLNRLSSLIQTEISSLWGVDKEIQKLSSTLSTIKAVVEGAEQKQFQDKAIENWLRKLKDAIYIVDDILDDWATEAIRLEIKGKGSGSRKTVRNLITSFYPTENTLFCHKMMKRMKDVRERLNLIADERTKFHLHPVSVDNQVQLETNRETGSILTQAQVYGRDEDKERIVKVLTHQVVNSQDITVYPIVGMGGLGKTTLAQMVFNDREIARTFEPRIWVCVSDDFEVKKIIKAIIESACASPCDLVTLDALQKRVQHILNGRKYLIVLDDMWNEDQEKWDKLKYVLACGSKGASIITTTRLEKVASIMGTVPSHGLSILSEDDCWLLFKERAFRHENDEEHPNLLAIGREIVKKCGGVPLAAKALGGILCFKREEKDWIFVNKSEIWNLSHHETSILPALRVSYFNLPLELRQCFAYCAVFPKDCRIEKEKLIQLWMANGFLFSNANLELEDVGDWICNELLERSFLQDMEKDEVGRITFTMHDLMHDLAQSIMENELHMIDARGPSKMSNQESRHVLLAIDYYGAFPDPEALDKVMCLRTILIQSKLGYRIAEHSMPFSGDFKIFGSLRAFDAGGQLRHLSSSIGNLKHLRYLDLSHTYIRKLPRSICTLWNLQTLKLDGCYELQRLPKKFKYLRSLRHLYLHACPLIGMPPRIGQLNSLTTLSLFVVGKTSDCHLAELKNLDLEGELTIRNLERVKNPGDAIEANLARKQHLSCLHLFWTENSESESQKGVEQLLEALEPHPNLKMLGLRNFSGAHFPSWMNAMVLKNLTNIKLDGCRNWRQLPPYGHLPFLKFLSLRRMDNLEYVSNDFPAEGTSLVRGFPSLERLNIDALPNLIGLSREEEPGLLPRLRHIFIDNCPKLTFPRLGSPEELGIRTNMVLSSIANLCQLTSLHVGYINDIVSFPEDMLDNLSALKSLSIISCPKLESLPEGVGHLTALMSLRIMLCHELKSLPTHGLQGLVSLSHLEIDDCNKLNSLPEGIGHLIALERLEINGCQELVDLPKSIKHLNSLHHLTMCGKPMYWTSQDQLLPAQMAALPEALQHVSALRHLSFSEYEELTSLPNWLGNLTSLRSLTILSCQKLLYSSLPESLQNLTQLQTLNVCCELTSFPDWFCNLKTLECLIIRISPNITSLPATIQTLTKLKELRIHGCSSELKRRCEKGTGEDWHKIAHIAYVSVYVSISPIYEKRSRSKCT